MAPSDPHPNPALFALLLAALCCPAWGKGGYSSTTTTGTTTTGYRGSGTGYTSSSTSGKSPTTGYRAPTTSSSTGGYYYYYSTPNRGPTTTRTATSYSYYRGPRPSPSPSPYPSPEPSPAPSPGSGWWPSPLHSRTGGPSLPSPPSEPSPSLGPSPLVASGSSRSPQVSQEGSYGNGKEGGYTGAGAGGLEEEESSLFALAFLIGGVFLFSLFVVSAALACISRSKHQIGGHESDHDDTPTGVGGHSEVISPPPIENPQPAMLGYPLSFEGASPYQLPDTTGSASGPPPPLPIHEPPPFPPQSGEWPRHSLYPDPVA